MLLASVAMMKRGRKVRVDKKKDPSSERFRQQFHGLQRLTLISGSEVLVRKM